MQAITIETARRAKAKVGDAVRRTCTVAGLGLTRIDGSYAVKVNLRSTPEPTAGLPETIDGVPIVYEVVGTIRAR